MSDQRLPMILDQHGNPLATTWSESSHYGASRTARDMRNWDPGLASADRELEHEREVLTARNRDIERNNGFAHGTVQTYIDNIVGPRLTLQALPDWRALSKDEEWAKAWADQVESMWRLYADSKEFDAARQQNFHQKTALVLRTAVTAGDALELPLWFADRRTHTVFQSIDPERLSNPDNRWDQPLLRGGVERNNRGEPIAYHIRKKHPTDFHIGREDGWVRVPARTGWGRRRALHVFDKQRVEQSRGKPWFSAILPDYKMADHYIRNSMRSAVHQSMISAFMETPLEAAEIAELFGTPENYLAERQKWEVNLEGGAVIPTFPGTKITPFVPTQPSDVFSSFLENIQYLLSAGSNLPRELVTKDWSKTNYSSARAGLLEAWRFFLCKRDWLTNDWASPCYELWLEEKVEAGLIEAPDLQDNIEAYTRCEWIGAGRGWVDELKEGQAGELRLRTFQSTLRDECARQGKNYEDVLRQRKREKELMEELGLNEADLAAVLTPQPSIDAPAGTEKERPA